MADKARRCCCCLFNILWKILITAIILVGLAILIFYIIVQPRGFRFVVQEAKLTQFSYNGNNNNFGINYNLVLNFTASNPNKKLNIYYDEMVGHAFYEGTRFGTTDVKVQFRQFAKSRNVTSCVFSGRHVIVLDGDQVSQYQRDVGDGVFRFDVKIDFKMRFRLGDFIGGYNKGNIKCKIDVPFGSNVTTNAFEPKKCEVNF